jgi:phage terminase large subunit
LIRIFGWNNKEIVKIRGGEYDLVIIDEAAFCNDLTAHFNMEIRPLLLTRMKHNPEVYFFSTPYGFNDFYYLSQMHKDHEDWSYHHHTWRDNPIIDPKDIEIIKAQMPEDEYLQEYEGMFRAIQGLIYKMFDHSKHVFKRASSNIYQTAVGVDFGYSEKGITAIVKINILDNRKYEIVKEKYLPGDTDIADVIDEIVSMTPDLVFADPGAPILVNQLKDRGLPVIDVVKGPGSVKAGITLVQGVIQQSRLYVSRKCTTVLSEFGSYIWKDRRGPDDEQKPKKVNNHLMDAIRYVIVMMEGGLKPVESRGIRKHKAKRKKWKGK